MSEKTFEDSKFDKIIKKTGESAEDRLTFSK